MGSVRIYYANSTDGKTSSTSYIVHRLNVKALVGAFSGHRETSLPALTAQQQRCDACAGSWCRTGRTSGSRCGRASPRARSSPGSRPSASRCPGRSSSSSIIVIIDHHHIIITAFITLSGTAPNSAADFRVDFASRVKL